MTLVTRHGSLRGRKSHSSVRKKAWPTGAGGRAALARYCHFFSLWQATHEIEATLPPLSSLP